ncbi:MAG: hypothetical protein PHE17_19650 [Thiothrix sp.]|uniref:hypothetical protein n=1 Tax=Thiothrix sp. TaxID=1032 RepID=UPI00260816D0|nr:hypothetical protein [Thiothrix sp.]MDD5395244.1 hypothetical protein [Thiothrix sp.]
MIYDSFVSWMKDRSRDSHRVILASVEFPYIGKILRYSNMPFTNRYGSYSDDWLTEYPIVDSKLGETSISTSFKAKNNNKENMFLLQNEYGILTVSTFDETENDPANVDNVWFIYQGSLSEIIDSGGGVFEFRSNSSLQGSTQKEFNRDRTLFNSIKARVPVCAGKPLNTTPEFVMTSSGYYYYCYSHTPAAVAAPALRINGIAKAATNSNLASSWVGFNTMPSGLVTADANVSSIGTVKTAFEHFALQANIPLIKFTGLTPTQLGYEIGFYSPSADTLTHAQVLEALAASCHCHLSATETGAVNVVSLSNDNTSDIEITDHDVIDGTIKHVSTVPPKKEVRVRYGKNWSVQGSDKLSTGADISKYSKEWLYVGGVNTLLDTGTAEFLNNSSEDNEISIDTLLINAADATTELNYWLDRMSKTKFVYSMDVYLLGHYLYVGKRVKLNLSEFKNADIYADVVRIIKDSGSYVSTIEVLFSWQGV